LVDAETVAISLTSISDSQNVKICFKKLANFILQRIWNHGIFKYLLAKGRPNWQLLQTKRYAGNIGR